LLRSAGTSELTAQVHGARLRVDETGQRRWPDRQYPCGQAFAAAGLDVAVIPGLAAAHSLPHVEVQPIRGSAPVRRLWAARPHDPFCPRPACAVIDTLKLMAKPPAADRGP
jgi:DNA-binding transcriptional LysR family regulator